MLITRTQITDCLNGYIKDYIEDAPWHINLVEDFMHLLEGDNFKSNELENPIYIKSIIENNAKNEYARKVLMRNTPETYISALFAIVIMRVSKNNTIN